MSDCLFCNMATGEMAVPKIFEDEHVFAIRDINPRAPVHALVIPRTHIPTVREIESAHARLLASVFTAATQVAEIEGVKDSGYRLAFNCGDDAGQTVYHIHLHVLGGRKLGHEG